ncbi:MAG: hypothetical protein ACFFDH_10655, partial [Promethearchaeota archaeon]
MLARNKKKKNLSIGILICVVLAINVFQMHYIQLMSPDKNKSNTGEESKTSESRNVPTNLPKLDNSSQDNLENIISSTSGIDLGIEEEVGIID